MSSPSSKFISLAASLIAVPTIPGKDDNPGNAALTLSCVLSLRITKIVFPEVIFAIFFSLLLVEVLAKGRG